MGGERRWGRAGREKVEGEEVGESRGERRGRGGEKRWWGEVVGERWWRGGLMLICLVAATV